MKVTVAMELPTTADNKFNLGPSFSVSAGVVVVSFVTLLVVFWLNSNISSKKENYVRSKIINLME